MRFALAACDVAGLGIDEVGAAADSAGQRLILVALGGLLFVIGAPHMALHVEGRYRALVYERQHEGRLAQAGKRAITGFYVTVIIRRGACKTKKPRPCGRGLPVRARAQTPNPARRDCRRTRVNDPRATERQIRTKPSEKYR